MSSVKIVHLTSVHRRFDTRIFFKECNSLKKNGYDVSLIVADGLGDEIKNGIKIFDVGKENSRYKRMLFSTKKILKKALELNADIYHFHDPELIPIGLKLKKANKKVVFDIHENVPLQIKTKEYLNFYIRNIISKAYSLYEKNILKHFDALILAENSYVNYYSKLNSNYEVVLNMPILEKLNSYLNFNRNKNHLFYIGGVNNQRGFKTTLQVIDILRNKFSDIFFHCVGPYNKDLLNMNEYKKVQENVKMYGALFFEKGFEISKDTKVGLSILQPIPNYINSYSTKIFEYMAVGLPVIVSNFKLYKDIVEKYNCGICVNPNNIDEIADAISYIFNNKEKAFKMGQNGRKAAERYFNWKYEEKKLLSLYNNIK